MKTFVEWCISNENVEPGKGNTTKHWRYKCPHCGGNAYTGELGQDIKFRGSAVCVNCKKGFAACSPGSNKLLQYAGEGNLCEKCGKESSNKECPWCHKN